MVPIAQNNTFTQRIPDKKAAKSLLGLDSFTRVLTGYPTANTV